MLCLKGKLPQIRSAVKITLSVLIFHSLRVLSLVNPDSCFSVVSVSKSGPKSENIKDNMIHNIPFSVVSIFLFFPYFFLSPCFYLLQFSLHVHE